MCLYMYNLLVCKVTKKQGSLELFVIMCSKSDLLAYDLLRCQMSFLYVSVL